MNHDIDDLLEFIKMLEERIIALEKVGIRTTIQLDDSWYWEHG